jgi:hypothetical protein
MIETSARPPHSMAAKMSTCSLLGSATHRRLSPSRLPTAGPDTSRIPLPAAGVDWHRCQSGPRRGTENLDLHVGRAERLSEADSRLVHT